MNCFAKNLRIFFLAGGVCFAGSLMANAARSCVTDEDLARSPLAKLARALENGDAETAADYFRFPFERPAPIPPIRNREEFITYFPTLFDSGYRMAIRKGNFAEDWKNAGWRGVHAFIGSGPDGWLEPSIHIDGSLEKGGLVYAVAGRPCAAERALLERLTTEDRGTLHPSLCAAPFNPVGCFATEDGKFAGRIDRLPKLLRDGRGNPPEIFRVALFLIPVHAGDKPETVFYATLREEGNGGNHSYLDIEWHYSLAVCVHDTEPKPGQELPTFLLVNWWGGYPEIGDMEWERPARYAVWRELLEP